MSFCIAEVRVRGCCDVSRTPEAFGALGRRGSVVGPLWSGVGNSAGEARRQVGFDRWGGDSLNEFHLRPSGDPAQCAARCERDARCRAWAFSYPATESPQCVCWLKSAGSLARRDSSLLRTRDVQLGARRSSSYWRRSRRRRDRAAGRPDEFAIDRTGGDYRHFDLPPDHTGKACQLACEVGRGRAAPGPMCGRAMSAPPPRCYLKDRITPPLRRPCCISGVVR